MKYLFILLLLLPPVAMAVAQNGNEAERKITAVRQAAGDLRLKYGLDEELKEPLRLLTQLEKLLVNTGRVDMSQLNRLQRDILLLHPVFEKELLVITRQQYAPDHHNTATLFQKGEINALGYNPGSSMKAVNLRSGQKRVLLESEKGIVRDPEPAYDGQNIIYSYRADSDDDYHIYEIPAKGGLPTQLTFARGVSDIDPVYLPDGDILFSATREPKYCMCNRHIMANLYRMEGDGANIVQLGKNTLFEGHPTLMHDGRIIYDRWEYVDRNFGDAQGLWTANPDGTNHAVFYGNNTNSPGGVIDPRVLPGSNDVLCVFGSCHDRPWGALALIDRTKGVDGAEAVKAIWPDSARHLIGKGNWDQFMSLNVRYEDPYPIDTTYYLCSRTIYMDKEGNRVKNEKMGIYLVDRFGNEVLLFEDEMSCFDPMPIASRIKEPVIPVRNLFNHSPGYFYVQNVYEGTHMKGVAAGAVKYMRVVESPEKRTYTAQGWKGQGEQAPGMNWHSFENKRILGEAAVEQDGSVYVEIPSNRFVYFQLLDKDKKMIQSMRSGTMVQPGEVRGCIGCHEDRLSVPINKARLPTAMRKSPVSMVSTGEPASPFNYAREVQPVFDEHCVQCHDFNRQNASGLVLAGDKNPFFNASYIDLHVKKMIKPIGGGPAAIRPAYSWGANVSRLVTLIEQEHHAVKLNKDEKERIYTWIDLNAVYYPYYESAYPDNMAGRSPLSFDELKELGRLTGVDFNQMNAHGRNKGPQIAFDRPELSPCLTGLGNNRKAYEKALDIITKGQQRLMQRPRAEMPGFVPVKEQREALKKYVYRLNKENEFKQAIVDGKKKYDDEN